MGRCKAELGVDKGGDQDSGVLSRDTIPDFEWDYCAFFRDFWLLLHA